MKTKDFVAIEKRLLPSLSNFAVKGQLLFIVPIDHTLRGFHFDGSSFDKRSFYVSAFFMPLCVPSKHVHLTFGRRVRERGGDRWSADEAGIEGVLESAIQKETPFLLGLQKPKDVAGALKLLTKPNDAGYVNPHCYEALAYVLVKAGAIGAAVDTIDALLSLVDGLKRANPAVALTWELEVCARAQLVKTKLIVNPEEANAQLVAWEHETVNNLDLENFCRRSHAQD
jgi:hypothetical protein